MIESKKTVGDTENINVISYKAETIEKIINVLNNITISGIGNITGLAAVINLLNVPDAQNTSK